MPKREEDLPHERNVFEVLVYLCFQNCISLTVSQYSHTLIQKLKIQFTQNFQNLFENSWESGVCFGNQHKKLSLCFRRALRIPSLPGAQPENDLPRGEGVGA